MMPAFPQVHNMRRWIVRLAIPVILTTAVVSGQQGQTQTPIFTARTDLVRQHVIVRDAQGRFVPDLRPDEFQIFEDGVPQKLETFTVSVGGRFVNSMAPEPPPQPADTGLILPRTRPATDISGRIFIIFIDDMHLLAGDSPKVRSVLRELRDTVLHEGDLIGYVSTGFSSIATDLSYDYKFKRFNEAIDKVMGSGMNAQEIIQANQTIQGPAGLRHNAHVAFSTAYDILSQAEKYNGRRKAFVYVSNGYDFNPFKDARFKHEQEKYAIPDPGSTGNERSTETPSRTTFQNPFETNGQQFAEADLVSELAELTRAAKRANVTFYTVDPRGLIAGPNINDNLSYEEWRQFVETSVSSLQVLAEETGGFCTCKTNDFKRYFQRIDNEMSDYYMIGYVSNNPDPMKIRRNVRIRITRPGLQDPIHDTEYMLDRSRRR
jgi:VWFA-related protein